MTSDVYSRLTFGHEDFHKMWFAVNVTLHASEVGHTATDNTTMKFNHRPTRMKRVL